MRTYIKIEPSIRSQIVRRFGITKKSIWEALCGLVHSEQSEQVRQFALANGGKVVCETYMPACTTVKTSTGLAQTFKNGVVVLLDLQDSTARIMRSDKELSHYENVDINAWANILWMAQELDCIPGEPCHKVVSESESIS